MSHFHDVTTLFNLFGNDVLFVSHARPLDRKDVWRLSMPWLPTRSKLTCENDADSFAAFKQAETCKGSSEAVLVASEILHEAVAYIVEIIRDRETLCQNLVALVMLYYQVLASQLGGFSRFGNRIE